MKRPQTVGKTIHQPWVISPTQENSCSYKAICAIYGRPFLYQ